MTIRKVIDGIEFEVAVEYSKGDREVGIPAGWGAEVIGAFLADDPEEAVACEHLTEKELEKIAAQPGQSLVGHPAGNRVIWKLQEQAEDSVLHDLANVDPEDYYYAD